MSFLKNHPSFHQPGRSLEMEGPDPAPKGATGGPERLPFKARKDPKTGADIVTPLGGWDPRQGLR